MAGIDDVTVYCQGQAGIASLAAKDGKILWQDTSGQVGQSMPANGRVYTVRADGKLHALDGLSGKQLWESAATGSSAPNLEYVDDDLVVTMDDYGHYYGIDAATGTTRWSYAVSGEGFGVAGEASTGQLILMVQSNIQSTAANTISGFTAVDPRTGKLAWQTSLVALYAPPKGSGSGNVLYGIDDGMNLLAIAPATGKTAWRRPTTLPTGMSEILGYQGFLSLDDGILYVYPSVDFNGAVRGLLAAFDAATGKNLWSVSTSKTLERGYAVATDTVCHLDGALHGLDARTGAAKWTAGSGLGSLQLFGAVDDVFLCAANGGSAGPAGLYGIDAQSGGTAWHYGVNAGTNSSDWATYLTPQRLYLAQSGRLLCFASRARSAGSSKLSQLPSCVSATFAIPAARRIRSCSTIP